jgi:predicted PurR-regulated permease PerM
VERARRYAELAAAAAETERRELRAMRAHPGARPGQVPAGVELAASWAWRFVIIVVAGLMVLWTLNYFIVVVLPVVLALFLSALLGPVVTGLEGVGVRRKVGAFIVVVIGIAVVGALLTFVGRQVSHGFGDLSDQVVGGLDQIRNWLRDGPLHASDRQINDFIDNAQGFITDQGKHLATRAGELTAAVGHVVAGLFIVLFSTYFFLADGKLIWAWIVRLFPRAARTRVDSSGRVAFRSLTQFVRATVLVAMTDAVGIMVWAAVLGLPLVGAIGVLVFLGAFIPLVGATVSGAVAVLVALVAKGPVVALIMLAGVIVVQQIEAHVLQPFLMGRFVSVHPLGVILAIAVGALLAGIVGALVAVPLAATLNAVVQHLAAYTEVGEDAREAEQHDPAPHRPDDADAAEVADRDDAAVGESVDDLADGAEEEDRR